MIYLNAKNFLQLSNHIISKRFVVALHYYRKRPWSNPRALSREKQNMICFLFFACTLYAGFFCRRNICSLVNDFVGYKFIKGQKECFTLKMETIKHGHPWQTFGIFGNCKDCWFLLQTVVASNLFDVTWTLFYQQSKRMDWRIHYWFQRTSAR